jgi:hypothetical protein
MDEVVELSPGQERHIQFRLHAADLFTVTCKARTRFYAGLFGREGYVARVNADGPGIFRFEFGSDKTGFTARLQVEENDQFFLVLRDGLLASRAQIYVQASLQRVGRVDLTIRSG